MADKVDYSKITLNFSDIMFKLHQIALNNAGENEIAIENTAFSDDNKFNGSGEFWLFLRPKSEEKVPDSQKQKYLQCAQEYVKYFVGEDAAKLIKMEDLLPMNDIQTEEPKREQKSDNENNKENSEQQSKNQEQSTANESTYITRIDRFLEESVKILFEDDTQPDNQDKGENTQLGFAVAYAIEQQGKQGMSLMQSLKAKRNSIFGGMVADLRNIRIKTLGGGSINVGKIFDPDQWKSKAGVIDLDIDTIDDNITGVIDNDFPRNDVRVRVWDGKSLVNYLNEKRKLTPEIKDKILESFYSVVIEIRKTDLSYQEFNKEKVAEICTRAFGTAGNLTNGLWGNKVRPDDVILINDIESKYKAKSSYELTRGPKDSTTSGKGTPTRESVSNRCSLDSIMRILFENEEQFLEKSGRHTAAHIKQQIDRYGSKNILLKKDLIIQNAKEYYKNDSNIRKSVIQLFEEFFKLPDNNSMKTFVDNKFGNTKKGDNIMNAFWKCLDGLHLAQNEKSKSNDTENEDSSDKNPITDMYIIPHKRLTSKNRKNQNDVYDDGTVKAKPSDEPYKPSDMRM